MHSLDHLVWGGPDLQAEIKRIERLTGVRAEMGGQHPGEGTWNALLRLGPATYLELIAPDPTQPPPHPRWFGLDALTEPRLITWAAKGTELERRRATARAAGVSLGEVRTGRRGLRSGAVLAWRLTYPEVELGDGVVPFLIDWGESPHPALAAPPGIELIDLRAEHPEPATIVRRLKILGLELPVLPGPRPALIATLDTPRGRVELR
ncbi:MAG TPA: VOC family protein [Gemmatimonadales bacterium]|nr:VOC family protein [Gemmatimonadales bacterium]